MKVQFVYKFNKVSLGTQLATIGYVVLYCNIFIMLVAQIIQNKHTHTKKNKENTFILIVQYLERYHNTKQQLASRGWHRVNK